MNELGLTRAAVREEMREILEDTVHREVNRLIETGTLGNIVTKTMHNLNSGEDISTLIRRAIHEQLHDYVADNYSINIDPKIASPSTECGDEQR